MCCFSICYYTANNYCWFLMCRMLKVSHNYYFVFYGWFVGIKKVRYLTVIYLIGYDLIIILPLYKTCIFQQWNAFAQVWHVFDAKWQNPFISGPTLAKYLKGSHKPIYHPMGKLNFNIIFHWHSTYISMCPPITDWF